MRGGGLRHVHVGEGQRVHARRASRSHRAANPSRQPFPAQVGAGLFAELDFTTEASHITRFRKLYEDGGRLAELGVVVPTVVPQLTSSRVLVGTFFLTARTVHSPWPPAPPATLSSRLVTAL